MLVVNELVDDEVIEGATEGAVVVLLEEACTAGETISSMLATCRDAGPGCT